MVTTCPGKQVEVYIHRMGRFNSILHGEVNQWLHESLKPLRPALAF